jgi:hypothetical protein
MQRRAKPKWHPHRSAVINEISYGGPIDTQRVTFRLKLKRTSLNSAYPRREWDPLYYLLIGAFARQGSFKFKGVQ